MNKLQNKWALITGSSRGIGQQIALGLAAEGCNIVVHASTLEHTQTTLALLSSYPVQTLAVAGELGNIAEEEAFTQKIIQDIGHIDILYNNAAVMSTWDDNVFNINTSECFFDGAYVQCFYSSHAPTRLGPCGQLIFWHQRYTATFPLQCLQSSRGQIHPRPCCAIKEHQCTGQCPRPWLAKNGFGW